jgi:hypothetical protein
LLTELARTKFYPTLLLYGEEGKNTAINVYISICLVDTNANSEVTPVKFISKFLPLLNETNLFVNRCFEVCRNTLLQIYGFFGLGYELKIKPLMPPFSEASTWKKQENVNCGVLGGLSAMSWLF